MNVEHVQVPGHYAEPIYSNAVRVGNLLFCSGIVAREMNGEVHAPDEPEEQATYCYEMLQRVLQRSGCTLKDVVKTTTYLTNPDHFDRIGQVRLRYFSPPLPASTTVVVSRLSRPGLLCEIDATAVIPDGK
jgi:2-iminobutanoate/2-iminopropanoate deaminase